MGPCSPPPLSPPLLEFDHLQPFEINRALSYKTQASSSVLRIFFIVEKCAARLLMSNVEDTSIYCYRTLEKELPRLTQF